MSLDDLAESLLTLREEIDAIDSEIIESIGIRNDHIAALMSVKVAAGLPVWDQKRVDKVIDHYIAELDPTGQLDGIKIATAIIGTQQQLEALYEAAEDEI